MLTINSAMMKILFGLMEFFTSPEEDYETDEDIKGN